jgi:flagellar basal-body rod modification protein FlgD
MTTISTSASEGALGAFGVPPQTHDTSLGQADFLRLMTEQLKRQDPLKPLDSAQFLGQLAQFSTVQGIQGMQGAMGLMANVMESDQTLRAATLVGHEAMVDGSSIGTTGGTTVHGEIVATSAGPMQLEVVDASGAVVRRITMEAPAAGNVPFEWDGRDDSGAMAPSGQYTIRAASGGDADPQGLAVHVAAHIDSVSIEASGLVLNLAGLGSVPLSAVRRIG